VVDKFTNPLAEQQKQLERIIVDYVSALTKQVVARELQMDSSSIMSAVHKSLEALPIGSSVVTLTVNPDDLALVELYSEKKHKNWKFISDESMLAGGCLLETPESLVDYSVETRMAALLEQFSNGQLFDEDKVVPEVEEIIEVEESIEIEEPEDIFESDNLDSVDEIKESEARSPVQSDMNPPSIDNDISEHQSEEPDQEPGSDL
jgi:hypothetical protein